ncbi:MAG: MarR family winged helix-turn-helix transcriptional regulator [Dermatophilaceae bacterium]
MGAPDSPNRLSDRRELVALLGELGGSLGRRFAAIAATERLTSAQWNLLRLLDEPQQMGWVARTLRCDPSNITALTRKLVDGGVAEVIPDPASARVRLLRRTPAGTRACRRLEKRLFEDFRPEGGLSAADLDTLTRLLAQVADGWRQVEDG